jgi:hypothetical protein
MDSLAATLAPVTALHKVLRFALVDKVEVINSINCFNARFNNPSISTNRHHMFQVRIRIAQVPQ